MKILYESDLAGSIHHGMAYRIYQFSSEFKSRGHEVMIVAASYSHVRRINPDVKHRLTDENIEGISYKWIKTPRYKGNGLGRVLHMIVYNFRLFHYAARIVKDFKPDVVIASGVTPLDFFGCRKIARIANAKVFLEVGDLWPLTPVELGNFSTHHPFIKFMQCAENYGYKNTDGVISLLPLAKDHMVEHGLIPTKFNYLPNGVIVKDWENSASLPKQHTEAINELKRKGKLLIGFAGTHSLSNALDTLLMVAERLQKTEIVFILVGDGPVKNELIRHCKSINLSNVVFLPAVKKESIPSFLNLMDILYIGFQKSSLYRFGVSPNKIFDYMMSGKPIVQAIEAGNNLVEEAKCGVYAEPGNIEDIASAILHLKNLNPSERDKLGKNGQNYVKANHSYDILTDKYLKVIESVVLNKN